MYISGFRVACPWLQANKDLQVCKAKKAKEEGLCKPKAAQ